MVLFRKKRLVKLLLLLLFISIVPYIFINSMEPQSSTLTEKRNFYNTNPYLQGDDNVSNIVWTLARPVNTTKGKVANNTEGLLRHRAAADLPMTIQYCNSPFESVVGVEGDVKQGFKLRMVHVFTRHGDRTPMHIIPGYQSDDFNCNFDQWYSGNKEKFKHFVASMNQFTGKQHRKSHFLNWALYPNKDKCDGSDLTSIGALQQLNNGEFLSGRYIGLFKKNIAMTSQVYVRSTATPRTYQSAVAFMYGFLPFYNISHLKIDHSSNDFLCSARTRLFPTCSCKNLIELQHRARRYKSAANAKSQEYTYIKKKVAYIFNLRDSNPRLPWLSAIIDAVVPAICHNISNTCAKGKSNKCIDGNLLERMWKEYARSQESSMADPELNYLKYISVQSNPIAVETLHRMRDLMKGRNVQKFVLYSGHDLTITAFLHLLGIHDGTWPPYASRIIFELYEGKNKMFYVRVLYNGRDFTGDVSFCKGKLFRGLCNFKHFSDFVFGHMLRRFGYTSYSDACTRR